MWVKWATTYSNGPLARWSKLLQILDRGIQLLSTSTYLPLAKVGRLCYIVRYSRFTRFTPLLTCQLSCRSPKNSPKVQIKVQQDTLKINTLIFPQTSFFFLVVSYLLLSPVRVMHCNYRSTFLEKQASISPNLFLLSWVKSCSMLSYVVDFTHQLFPFELFPPWSRLSWNFYL